MKILLFGSSGMVGTAVEVVCDEAGVYCVGLNHADIEITDTVAVESAIDSYRPDVVVNSVAIVGIPPCEDDPDLAFRVNTTAVAHMADVCGRHNIHLVQFSSHAVFDGRKEEPYTEDDPATVMNIYAGSKYLAECFAMNLCHRHYVIRLPTLFGPRRNQKLGFVDKMITRIRAGQKLRVADDRIDTPTYTLDVARRIVTMLQEGVPSGLYHLANAGPVSYYDFIRTLVEYLGAEVDLVRAKDADFPSSGYKPLRTALMSQKIAPMRPWEDALREYVDTYLKVTRRNV